MGLDVLIISPYSGVKRFDAVIGPEGVDSWERTELLNEYPNSVASAAEMYTGRGHEHIESAVQELLEFANADWRIISAGFGVLSAGTEIPSYECALSEIEQVRQWAERTNLDVDTMTNDELAAAIGRERSIPQDLRQILAKGYDLVFVTLGTKYLTAVQDTLTLIPEETTAFAFASKGNKEPIGDCYWIPATEAERSDFNTTWLELRGRELLTLTKNLESAERVERMKINSEGARELSISA